MKPINRFFKQLKPLLFFVLFSICAFTQTTAQTTFTRETDSLALVALYNATDGPNWTNKTNWLTGNLDAWYGVTVSANRVMVLELPNNRLTGTVPSEIYNLTDLAQLNLAQNSLSGNILPQISNLNKLKTLKFQYNILNGSVPPEIGNLTNLNTLYLTHNQLSGSIPPEIGNLVNLLVLNMAMNQLSGNIPSEISEITGLYSFSIFSNKFGINNIASSNIIPDINNLIYFNYAPQAKLQKPTIELNGNTVTLTVSDQHFANHYSWYANGVLIEGNDLSSYTFIPTETTEVYVKITNDIYTIPGTDYQDLVLETEPIIVEPVIDLIPPTVLVQDITIYLDENGNARILAGQVDNGSYDASGIASMILSQTDFDCSYLGTNTVTLTITDMDGNSASAEALVIVVDDIAPVAVAQSVTLYLDQSGSVTLTENQVDNGSSDNCGIESMTLSQFDFDCSNIGENQVVLTVADASGNVSVAEAVVTVIDQILPSIIAPADIALEVHSDRGVTVELGDPEANDNCNVETIENDAPSLFFPGETEVTWTVTDASGNNARATQKVTVTFVSPNQLPVIHSITSNSPVYIMDAAEVTATFTDDNPETATWDWGDGSSSEGFIIDQQVTGSHYYGETGFYDVTLTIEDAYGENASLVYSYIVVYDPDQGHVTGGGWIDSGTGDYLPSTEKGKANYGFSAQYDQHMRLKGNLAFHLNSAKFKVNSTGLEWLAINYDQAIFKGTARVNNVSGYEFIVSVIDGQVASKYGQDLFRIRVWETGGELIYDNQGDDVVPNRATDPIAQGEIIIHKNKTTQKGKNKSASLSDPGSVISQDGLALSPNIYPNPATSELNVVFPENKTVFYDIVDMNGRIVVRNEYLPFQFQDGMINLDQLSLKTGMYILRLREVEGNQTYQFCFEKN